ncbi:MAG: ABC transporter substrate-binding protein [Clostridiales Family XIII bacterium]|nr:ABC transporter substrate-binding protein [Clostridiales Family XIII bacterium]
MKKRLLALGLCAMMVFSFAACGSSDKKGSGGGDAKPETTFDTVKIGEDFTDLKADVKWVSHRTDLVDNVYKDYISEFNKLYPNIKISVEGITDYAESMTTRLTTGDWGDLCMIPTTVPKTELTNYFSSFGPKAEIEKNYIMLENFSYKGEVYGIPSVGNAQGVVYNKKVFEQAGVTDVPKTPEEYLAALKAIKDKTDAIPLYTNFAANWTMGAWDAYIGGSSTGDADFMNGELVHGSNPFTDNGKNTGPYAVYNVLYQAVAQDLTEDDPTTTDWENSKIMINNGEIGSMVLGSWSVVQMQDAGPNADDIAYMPFPITVDGKQYASAGPDYDFGINKNSSADDQTAALLFVKWFTDESNFAFDQGGVPITIDAEYPEVLKAFDGVELVIDTPAPEGEEDLFSNINTESEVGLNSDNYHVSIIVEAAIAGTPTLDEIVTEWNEKWSLAQESQGA